MEDITWAPVLCQREVDVEREIVALEAGLDPVIAKILASRPWPKDKSIVDILSLRLAALDSPGGMLNLDRASLRIASAILNDEYIGLETDHDCDGQTSHAILLEALITYFGVPRSRIYSYIGHRLTEGYGLSQSVANRILATPTPPTLIITADNGSSDEPRIKRLKEAGIDVIVTDHHEIPKEGVPQSAFAVLNPTQSGCLYPDKYIAGCMVAWLLMTAVRNKLIEVNYLPISAPKLSLLLDFVAVGTVADCVSFARSINNRIVVNYGLKLIGQGLRPCFVALRSAFAQTKDGVQVTAEDLGFKIGPLLNSDGRLDSALQAVEFLTASDVIAAHKLLSFLEEQNSKRKVIQKNITQQGMLLAREQILRGKLSICIFLANGHSGVHGIAASRIKDVFGAPVVIFSPKGESGEVITGSVRGINKLHIRNALQEVAEMHPGLILSFGGHKGAAGVSIKLADLARFEDSFEEAVKLQIVTSDIGPVILTDGHLPLDNLSFEFIKQLNTQLEPFGREFEAPVFEAIAKLVQFKLIGQEEIHASLDLSIDGIYISAIWFNLRQGKNGILPIAVGDTLRIAYIAKIETYKGNVKLKFQILHGSVMAE